jgi:hypothetical protein
MCLNGPNTTDYPKELISSLRTEIVESQKARIDLLKYKLIAIAALGSIGLGLGSNQHNLQPLIQVSLLAIIPLVCLYIDQLCYHNTMRILVIGQFFKAKGCQYENFIPELGKILPTIGPTFYKLKLRQEYKLMGIIIYSPYRTGSGYFFELEDLSLQGSTIIVSFILCILSLCFHYSNNIKAIPYSILLLAGISGMTFSMISYKYFERHKETLFAAADGLGEQNKNDK